MRPCGEQGTQYPQNLLIIGLAAGTVSELYTDIYGPLPITGIELDPQIIEVGQAYFDMMQPNLTAVAADGRRWLADQPDAARWDVIAIDAYRPPYIPFHLTTIEFFTLVRDHLMKMAWWRSTWDARQATLRWSMRWRQRSINSFPPSMPSMSRGRPTI
ncbi:MAG: fused MFS/spermidine synthase [Caldilineaceae bacterium]